MMKHFHSFGWVAMYFFACCTFQCGGLCRFLSPYRVFNTHKVSTLPLAATKKKKKIASSTPINSNAPSSQAKPPQRITNTINIPVRQQIAWARAYKRLISTQSSTSTGSTRKFRQDKGPKEVEEEYKEIDYELTKPPAVFVDGYNIIGYINSVEGRQISFDDARDCLISDLCVLRGATGWCIEVVFDAYKVMGPEKSESIDNVAVTYTSKAETAGIKRRRSADDYC